MKLMIVFCLFWPWNVIKACRGIGCRAFTSVAGLLAGFTRRTSHDFGKKEKLILSEWNEKAWAMEYKLNTGYINKLKTLLSGVSL